MNATAVSDSLAAATDEGLIVTLNNGTIAQEKQAIGADDLPVAANLSRLVARNSISR